MKQHLLFLVFSSFLSLFFNLSPLRAASIPIKVVITFGGFGEREGVLFIASDQGFFQKHGLDVKLVHVRSGAVGISALAAREAHFDVGSATGTTLGAIAGGLDAAFVAAWVNKLSGTFVVKPAIKIPSDLKGKTIGVVSIGGGVWMFTMLALEHWGLNPERDKITIRVVGDEPILAQSIAAGVIDGSYLSYTYASKVERQGFSILSDLAKLGVPFQGTGIVARRSFCNPSPDVCEKVIRSLVEAIAFILEPRNKAAVMKSLAHGLQLPRVEDAAEGYERMITLYDRRLFPNAEGIRNAIRLLGTANEKIRRLKAEDLVDDSFVKKLEQEGRF